MSATIRKIQLIETAGCHLCTDAHAILLPLIVQSPHSYQLIRVDVADAGDLLEPYGVRIPVIKRLDNNTELDWPFDTTELEFFLQ